MSDGSTEGMEGMEGLEGVVQSAGGPRRRPAAVVGVAGAAAVVVVALVAAGLAGCGGNAGATASAAPDRPSCGSSAPKLTVQGSGVATGTPNLLTLTLSVDETAGTAQEALAADNTTTAAVVGVLRTGGVTAAHIQTTGLSIQPDYQFEHGTNVLTGYAVDNDVVAMLTNFGTAGSVIDAAAGTGGNAVQIDSLSFSLADPRPLQDAARLDAVHQAVSHAATMAAGAGERLGPVCSLTDDTQVQPDNANQQDFSAAGTAAAPASTVPVEAGSQEATAQVTMVYSLVARPPVTSARRRSGPVPPG